MKRDKNPDERREARASLPASDRSAAPSSRWGRLARLSALAPRAFPVALEGAKRAVGIKRTDEQERIARQRTYENAKKAGTALLKTLGEMKGLPMKLGQMFSYIDGLAPPGYEDKVQRLLQQLREKAPPLSPEAAEQMVVNEFGVEPSRLFAHWERLPFAAASIGQVHRAVTRSGEEVAVKVQYPGIDKAVENDLKSLSMLEIVIAPLSRQYQSKETLHEITKVFLNELDYGLEAENTDLFRRLLADLPSVVIPHIYHSLSTRRVLTAEMLHGIGYEEFRETASQTERDQAGATIWTFMMRSLLRHGVLYADPHPGNYRFLDGGRVGFLDFGCVKILPPTMVQGLKAYMAAVLDANWPEFDRLCHEFMGMDPSDKQSWDLYRSYALELLIPIATHSVYECTPEGAKETVQFLVRGQRKLIKEAEGGPKLPTPMHMPFDLTFVNRLQWGLASILGGLGTRARFRELTEPWIRASLEPTPS
jgi:predicted unusual protein kinase regulating ubiquinone biosynthesis (AarF/ABC1/UbiB family)